MIEIVTASWMFIITIVVTAISYVALQAIDFSTIFKKSSTWQIRILILFLSLALGLIIGCGFGYLIKTILEIF